MNTKQTLLESAHLSIVSEKYQQVYQRSCVGCSTKTLPKLTRGFLLCDVCEKTGVVSKATSTELVKTALEGLLLCGIRDITVDRVLMSKFVLQTSEAADLVSGKIRPKDTFFEFDNVRNVLAEFSNDEHRLKHIVEKGIFDWSINKLYRVLEKVMFEKGREYFFPFLMGFFVKPRLLNSSAPLEVRLKELSDLMLTLHANFLEFQSKPSTVEDFSVLSKLLDVRLTDYVEIHPVTQHQLYGCSFLESQFILIPSRKTKLHYIKNINVVQGLPQELTIIILLHELVHCALWLRLENVPGVGTSPVEELICHIITISYINYRLYSESDPHTRKILIDRRNKCLYDSQEFNIAMFQDWLKLYTYGGWDHLVEAYQTYLLQSK